MAAGPAQGSSNGGGSDQQNEKKKVSCIVKFRPCKDWRGEYGFDWMREGSKDFEERIDLRDVDLTKKQKEQVICSHMGKEKYRKWQRKLVLNILNANTEQDADKAREEYQKAYDSYFNKLSDEEVTNNFDDAAWQSEANMKNDTFSEAESDVDDGFPPMEYSYPAKYVTRVEYVVNRKAYGHVWFTSRLEYEDMANGSDEIQDKSHPAKKLHYLVNIKGHIQSMDKDKTGMYAVPCYYDSYDPFGSNYAIPTSFGKYKLTDKLWFEEGDDSHCKTIQKAVFDEFLRGEKEVLFAEGERATSKVVKFKKFADTDQAMDYCFKYIRIKGKLHTVASVACKYENADRLCRCHFIDGNLDEIYVAGKWKSLDKAKKDEKTKEESTLLENMAKEMFSERMIGNYKVSIAELLKLDANEKKCPAKEGVLDNIHITLNCPFVKLNEYLDHDNDGFEEKDGKVFWGDYEINTWKDRYAKSFRHLDVIYVDENGNEIDPNYRIPVLSFGVSDYPRKRFTFRTLRESPKKEIEQIGEFKLQLRIEGDCPKLRFTSNNPSAVVVEPAEMDHPKDHDEITVKFVGNTPCYPSIMAECLPPDSEDEEDGIKTVGQLDVHIEDKKVIDIGLVYVLLDGKPLSSKFSKAIDDNVDLMTNALLQAGMEPNYITGKINIKSSAIKKFMKGKDLDFEKTSGLDKLLYKELNKQRKYNLKLRFSYLIFCIDKGITDDIAGYSGPDPKIIVISNSSAYYRADVSTLIHELLHALDHPHHFQLNLNNDTEKNEFCFPIKTSSNIMDYYTLNYSLHKYQWHVMRRALDAREERIQPLIDEEQAKLDAEAEEKKKKNKIKRDRLGRIII